MCFFLQNNVCNSHHTTPVIVVLRSGAIIALNKWVATPVPKPTPTGTTAPSWLISLDWVCAHVAMASADYQS
eukprot:COSAG02_NODE_64094_length_261_cov_0.950617_1_plen_71_part_01